MSYRDHFEAENEVASVYTRDGYHIKSAYVPADISDLDYETEIGHPGSFPFVRGIFGTKDRPRRWRSEHYAGFGGAGDSRRRFEYLRETGTSGGVSIALDLPTQLGLDSDHPLSLGEVGSVGVAIDTLADMERLFEGWPLNEVGHVFSTANSIGPIFLAMIIALAEQQDVPLDSFTVQIQNDSLKEYFARGTQIYPVRDALRLSTDVVEYSSLHCPEWSPLSISGAHIRAAGSTALQELVFTIADGIVYVEEALKRGLNVDQFAGNLELHFTIQMNMYEEIAKLRSARGIWSKLMRNRFGALTDEATAPWMTTATSGVTLTAQEPLNNIVRTTLETVAAILGGANNHRIASYDEAIGIPTREAAKVAVRIPQILTEEGGLNETADPLGGSYFLEHMTKAFEDAAWSELERIEDIGGAVVAVEEGVFFREIVQSAIQHQRDLEQGTATIVGVNRHTDDAPREFESDAFEVDIGAGESQIERLRRVKEMREADAVRVALEALQDATEQGRNVVPSVIGAVKAYATVGEICDVWRSMFGEWSAEGITL